MPAQVNPFGIVSAFGMLGSIVGLIIATSVMRPDVMIYAVITASICVAGIVTFWEEQGPVPVWNPLGLLKEKELSDA